MTSVSVLKNAVQLLHDVHESTDTILVGLSGGKDSLAVLDLAVNEFGADNVQCYFMYFVRGLRCVETIIKYCERRYKVKVHYYPHPDLSRAYKYAQFMPHRANAGVWRETKIGDIEQAVRVASGIDWLAYGHRMTDSLERRAMLHKLCGFDLKGRRVYPLWKWNANAVYAYIRGRRIPLPPRLTFNNRVMTGVGLQEDVLLFLKQKYPDDYAKVLEVFPYVEARLARRKFIESSWRKEGKATKRSAG